MSDGKSEAERGEERHEPYFYMPEVVINPESDEQIRGTTRDVSEHGFSATFHGGFPFEEGEIIDVRVGYERAWAQVVWSRKITDDVRLVGFRLHPQNVFNTKNQNEDR